MDPATQVPRPIRRAGGLAALDRRVRGAHARKHLAEEQHLTVTGQRIPYRVDVGRAPDVVAALHDGMVLRARRRQGQVGVSRSITLAADLGEGSQLKRTRRRGLLIDLPFYFCVYIDHILYNNI